MVGATRTVDRRQRKSRAALQGALLQLIATKPYDAITIDDIAGTADVARATFYAHYRDKPAMLLEAGGDLITDLAQRIGAQEVSRPTVFDGGAVSAIVEHAGAHPHLYGLILSGRGGAEVRARVLSAFEQAATQALSRRAEAAGRSPRVPLDVTTTAFVGALVRTVEAWLDAGMATPSAELVERFLHSQLHGVEWSLGFEPGEARVETRVGTTARPEGPGPG